MRSRFNRLIANRLMARWAACGGLNEPPSRPTRMPGVYSGIAWPTGCDATDTSFNECTTSALLSSRPCLSGAVAAIFKTGQLLGADRAAGVKFSGGDADFSAEAEFAAVGELRRRVMQHDRRVDL